MTQGFTQTLPQNSFRTMKVFVLTETDSTDTTWCYNEVFTNFDKAKMRMKELYHDNVIMLEDLIVKAEYNDMDAYGETADGKTFAWNIKECELN